jgi:hypothetical protein
VLLLTDGQAQGPPAAGAGQGAAGPEPLARQLGAPGSSPSRPPKRCTCPIGCSSPSN